MTAPCIPITGIKAQFNTILINAPITVVIVTLLLFFAAAYMPTKNPNIPEYIAPLINNGVYFHAI